MSSFGSFRDGAPDEFIRQFPWSGTGWSSFGSFLLGHGLSSFGISRFGPDSANASPCSLREGRGGPCERTQTHGDLRAKKCEFRDIGRRAFRQALR